MIDWNVQSSILFIRVGADLTNKDASRVKAAWFDRLLDRSISEITIYMSEVRIMDYHMMNQLAGWLSRTAAQVSRIHIKGLSRPLFELMKLCHLQQWCELIK